MFYLVDELYWVQFVSGECKGSISDSLTFYKVLIFSIHFSTGEHSNLSKAVKLFLPSHFTYSTIKKKKKKEKENKKENLAI